MCYSSNTNNNTYYYVHIYIHTHTLDGREPAENGCGLRSRRRDAINKRVCEDIADV